MGIWAIIIGVVLILLSIQLFRSTIKTYRKLKNGKISNPSTFIMYALWTSFVIAFFIAVAGIITFSFY